LNAITSPPSAQVDPRLLLRDLSPYRKADPRRSLFELAVTAAPFAALWGAMVVALQVGHLIVLALAVPAGVFLLRLFLIQHDCGHGSFFHGRAANDWVGRVLGVLTLTPYDYWRRSHAAHHAGTCNLDARGVGDLDTLTVAEFKARGPAARLAYRLYRNPLVLFGIAPGYVFLLKHRLPLGMTKQGWAPWASAMGTNAAVAAAAVAMSWLVGWQVFLLVHIPVVLVAATLGVWFFYVQHQFERTVWEQKEQWSFHEAALFGSSHYVMPRVLRWLSANVGIHHVHHLASRIPFYRLDEAVRDLPALGSIGRVDIGESLRSVRLVLWDERQRRLVSFKEAGV
jgi:omega-6 fatty acid desaturase (delta-12 desaturase)